MRNQGASNRNPQRHNFCVPIHINYFVLQGQNNPDKYNSSKEGLVFNEGLEESSMVGQLQLQELEDTSTMYLQSICRRR